MKALIIDDEKYTREGIRRQIDWNGLGITRVELAEDGRQGVELARAVRPDLVICDISMPIMNGIECADQIVGLFPSCKIIFLSGYSDKDYLKSAIRLRAVDYIEKPLQVDELRGVIEKTVRLLKQERPPADPFQLLQGIDPAKSDASGLAEELGRQGYRFAAGGQYVALTVKCAFDSESAYAEQAAQVPGAWQEAFPIPAQQHISGQSGTGPIVAYVSWGKHISREQLQEACRLAINRMKAGLAGRTRITVGVGAIVTGLLQLKHSEQSAVAAAEQDFILGPDRIIWNERFDNSGHYGSLPDFQPFLAAVRRQRLDEALACLRSEADRCRQAVPTDILYIKKMIENTALQLFRYAEDEGSEQVGKEAATAVRTIASLPYLDDMIHQLEELAVRFAQQDANRQSVLMRKVTGYIAEHCRGACTIEEVARSVHMSPAYLCILFKKQIGMTMNQYTNKVRMEKAQELLRDPTIKVYEIAQLAGFQDHNYFTRLFRRQYGCSPSEYRRKQTP
ncbi:MAG: response regulator [Cohnella sp.]|nr:response regulator [Cohnella sp.]